MAAMELEHGAGLKRNLGLIALLVYGIGDILGAGIYALVGKVAGLAGAACWLSFAAAMLVAGLTALTYAELVSRYPRAGGEAYFSQRAFQRPWLGLLIGWLVLCSGVVSLATVSLAFAGYFQQSVPAAPDWAVVLALLVVLGIINFRGITESSWANIVCTAVEVTGLLIVLMAGLAYLYGGQGEPAKPLQEDASWLGVARGAAVAFFAFIGFEDMINIAEEAKQPHRHLPYAILAALLITGSTYIVIAWLAVAVVPLDTLAASDAPLHDVVHQAWAGFPDGIFTVIALFAVANTGLLNFIMGSRLLYGMSRQGLLPPWLGIVHPTRRTPHRAILTVFAIALLFALTAAMVDLAGTTSALLLTIFVTMNLSLLVIKRREGTPPEAFRIPAAVPLVAIAFCLGLIGFVPLFSLIAAPILLGIGILIIVARGRHLRHVSMHNG